MSRLIMDIFPLLLLLLAVWKIKPVRPFSSFNEEDYLLPETCKNYRGICAMAVVACHLAKVERGGFVFPYMTLLGYLGVSVFFFLSGYGLQKSYLKKGDAYRKGFLSRRLPTILIPYAVINVLYWIVRNIFSGSKYSPWDFIVSFVNGNPLANNSWYIIAITGFYILFRILMAVSRGSSKRMLIGSCIGYAAYVAFCRLMHYATWWYATPHLFVAGIAWAIYEKQLLRFIKRNYHWVLSAAVILFCVLFAVRARMSACPLFHILAAVTALLFVLSILLIALKFRIGNRVTKFLGGISLEIYLSHGLFFIILRSDIINIGNGFLWVIAELTLTILFSLFLHKLFAFLLEKYRKLLNRA